MAKTFVRVDMEDETVLIDLARISYCEIREDDSDEKESYYVVDANDKVIVSFDVNLMSQVVDAIEAATQKESWGDVPD